MTDDMMKAICLGDERIDGIDPQVFYDLLACAGVGCEGADDVIGTERADAVWSLLRRIDAAVAGMSA